MVGRSREETEEAWGGAAGLLSLVLGIAGGALERGWPAPSDPDGIMRFVAGHRTAILAQSMLFVLSAAAFLWFLATLRSILARADRGGGALAGIVFGGGVAWVAMQMVAQSFQVGQAMAPPDADPALLATMAATFSIANLPLAVALLAFAIAALRDAAFPRWLGFVAAAVAGAEVLLFAGTVATRGPLAPNGWLTYVLYPAFAVWLVPTSVLISRHRVDGSRRGGFGLRGGHAVAGRGVLPWHR